jgi:KDO2-lipid IV(A) lauroyltransferase
MNVHDFFSGRKMVRLGVWIGQHLPRWVGYGLSKVIAFVIVLLQTELYTTLYDNLAHVVDAGVSQRALRRMARRVLAHAGQTYYDFFHALGQPSDVLAKAVAISPALVDLIHSEMRAGRGVLLLGVHMSNFDLGLLALGANDLSAQVLSLAGLEDGFALLNELREMEGLEMTPITPRTLRMAIERLRGGGLVMTGVDWPIPDEDELIEFFGRPAYLPVGLARLALMTDATVLLGACYHDPEGGYVLDVTGPIELVNTGDRKADAVESMRRLAKVIEGYVSAHPEQWVMFHPVWPQASPDPE